MVAARDKNTYVAFLRGINVGGHKKVPMPELRKLYESLGLESVRTLLNSGNVVFKALPGGQNLAGKIEGAFREKFGFESKTTIRTMAEIEALIRLNPFKNIKIHEDVRLYVTFLRSKSRSTLRLPYTSPKEDFRILQKTDREVFSVLTVRSMRSVAAMAFLEKEFGKDVTTRNWNTVQKLAGMAP